MFVLDETATIWVVTRNGFGESSFSRHEIKSKHAQKQSLFTDKNGNQALSQAVLYFDSVHPTLSTFVVFGVDAALTPPDHAYEIKAFAAIPSEIGLKKAWL